MNVHDKSKYQWYGCFNMYHKCVLVRINIWSGDSMSKCMDKIIYSSQLHVYFGLCEAFQKKNILPYYRASLIACLYLTRNISSASCTSDIMVCGLLLCSACWLEQSWSTSLRLMSYNNDTNTMWLASLQSKPSTNSHWNCTAFSLCACL